MFRRRNYSISSRIPETRKSTNKRALAVKQKIEGLSYRTIAKNIGVNYYRNIYRIVDAYRQKKAQWYKE